MEWLYFLAGLAGGICVLMSAMAIYEKGRDDERRLQNANRPRIVPPAGRD